MSERIFSRGTIDTDFQSCTHSLHLVLPLATPDHVYGLITVATDLTNGNMSPMVLRRIDQIRQSLIVELNHIYSENVK
jgi:hypothetical protein